MEYLDTEETKFVFSDLKKSIHHFYAKYSELEKNGIIDMSDIKRNCDKMEHYINSEFYNLWQMEQEERRNLAKKLENAVLMCCRSPCNESNDSDDESDTSDSMPPLIRFGKSDTCDLMPPLIRIDTQQCPLQAPEMCPLEASDISEYKSNDKDYTKSLYSLYYTPPSTSIWNWGSNSSVLGALAFNKNVLDL